MRTQMKKIFFIGWQRADTVPKIKLSRQLPVEASVPGGQMGSVTPTQSQNLGVEAAGV